MKALHITFRYGKDVYGGAELYFRNLSEELFLRGVSVDICTTQTHTLTPFIKSGTAFDNTLRNEKINSVRVLRFPVIPQNRYLSFFFEKLIQRQRDHEESECSSFIRKIVNDSLLEQESSLADGWNQIERYGESSMRWTKSEASFSINDTNISKISFFLTNPKKIHTQVEVSAQGHYEKRTLQSVAVSQPVSFQLKNFSGLVTVKIHCQKTWHPMKDFRSLGVAISEIHYETSSGMKTLDLEMDYRYLLNRQDKYIPYLMHLAKNRPKYFSLMFDYLRGPWSPMMEHWLEKNISDYDVVLAQMFPFNTIKYSLIAKKYKKPLILLPLMHVDDEFYHWGHYYDMLKSADCIFALTSFSKKQVYDKLGSTCINIGAGIDQKIFLNENVDGSRFREKYHLEGKKIILTVSRKSPLKHYEYIIRAIDEIYDQFNDIVMVMIGPDEDKIAIKSKNVVYLGKIGDKELVDAYDACDIFAMMSESESFGMVFCEAWSRKKPVIGNRNCGAVAALIDDNLDGFLCSGKKELVSAITKLLTDKETAALFGQRGYEKVIKNYTWEIIADRVLTCYNTVTLRDLNG